MGHVTTVTPVDLESARSVAVTAAEAAGAILREAATKDLGVRAKDASGDVVTDLDLAAERLIIKHIRDAFPGHRIIAEESGLLDADDSSWTWLVDPLDGTNNVVIGLSAYVVGVALCENKVPVLGVVHDPVAGQTWSAVRGRGTRGPSGVPVRPPYRPTPCGPVLAWTQGHGVGRTDDTARAMRMVLESGARRVLQLWAPLLSWVMLARGDIDGFVGYQPEAVDLPAGSLIAQEAGITVCGLDGFPFDERIDLPKKNRSFVAGRPEIIRDLLARVRTAQRVTISGVTA
ncbi:MAG: inositol monophosphatase family protein [Pseudonocardiaceae bacterium]